MVDLLQLVQMADMDHRGDVAHVLGHPKPDIGGTGHDRRLRMRFVEGRQIVIGWRERS
jgi:hypothetical protein